MPARIAAFLVWAAVAACAAFWGLRVLVTPRPVPSQTEPVASAEGRRADVLRLFAVAATPSAAASASAPGLASRFKLIGVMAPKEGERGRDQGIALIAVDEKPPRAYRVGAPIDNALVLQSVAVRSATIGPAQGEPAVQLDLPPLPPPATGSLPAASGLLPAGPVAVPPPAAPDPGPGPSGPPRDLVNRR
ncbi:type II secretion system protein N [Methylibium sp.]|uniref:type II secretion system protein N n=1 Tax=Methylibium sp. TaxID=2067992 RepID=UPI003D13D0DD